jgi:hypothetical protein
MTLKQRSALLNDGRVINLYVPHPTEEKTWIVTPPTNLSRSMVMAFCKAARSQASQNGWRIQEVPKDVIENMMKWCKQSCRAETIAPYDLEGLSTSEKIDHIAGAGLLGISPGLLKLQDTYFELPADEFVDLWRSASEQDLTNISNVMKRQYPAYVHGCKDTEELMTVYNAAANFNEAQGAVEKAIWYKVNRTKLELSDVAAFHKHAKNQAFTKKAIRLVADGLWDAYQTKLPAELDTELAQALLARFNVRHVRYYGYAATTTSQASAAQTPSAASGNNQPVSGQQKKDQKKNGSAKRRAKKAANAAQ